MRLRLILWSFVALLFLVPTCPEYCEASPQEGEVKKKKRKGKGKRRKGKKGKKAKANEGVEDAAAGDAGVADESSPAADEESFVEESGGGSLRSGGEGALRTSSRMEFDERLVKGQAAKSGAVYLFKRVPRQLPGLVPMRRSYRRRIVEPILGFRELKPAIHSGKVDRLSEEQKAAIAASESESVAAEGAESAAESETEPNAKAEDKEKEKQPLGEE